MITIQELLFNRGLDKSSKIKLVRHKDNRLDLYNLYRTNRPAFLEYQNSQVKDVFNGVDYLIERVIIRWENAISWHQWIKNEMEVIEIHPGLHYKQFKDYSDFILNFDELKEIVSKQYSDWKKMLSVTKGIYLISDTKTGKLYVGSAYGEDGIWGRWCRYVSTNGHGDNKTLKELIADDSTYGNNFQFSILMLLPRTITADEAIKKERLFKNKLGTNAFGLNNN